jgi:hypothetical protein
LDKRKIYFWTTYAVFFAILFMLLRWVFYSYVPDTKWMDALFVVLLFVIVSPVSTIVSTKVVNRFLGAEEK